MNCRLCEQNAISRTASEDKHLRKLYSYTEEIVSIALQLNLFPETDF